MSFISKEVLNFNTEIQDIVDGLTTQVDGMNDILQEFQDNDNYLERNKLNTGYAHQGGLLGVTSIASVDYQYLAGDSKYYKLKSDTTVPYTHDGTDTPNTTYFEEVSYRITSDKVENLQEAVFNTDKVYGVEFSGSDPIGTRILDAIDMVAEVGLDDSTVTNDFDSVSFFDRPICCGTHDSDGNFTVNAYKGDPDFASDGSNGEVFYECTPFYWNESYDRPCVTASARSGYKLAPMFQNDEDKVYLPVYWMSMVDSKATSRSGTFPVYNSVNGHMANARTYDAANAHIETMKVRMSEYVLQLVEFATKDLQTIMMGASTMAFSDSHVAVVAETVANRIIIDSSYAAQFVTGQTIAIGTSRGNNSVCLNRKILSIEDYDGTNSSINFDGDPVDIAVGNVVSSRPWVNGALDVVEASSGSIGSNTSGKYPCIWRGKVDPWGDAFSGLCDVLVQRNGTGSGEDPYTYRPYVIEDPRLYSSGTITDAYIELNYDTAQSDGYAKTLGQDSRYPYASLTSEAGAASTTYLSGYYYSPRYDVSAVFAGGYWDGGRSCSPVCFHLNNSPSYSSISRLARLFVTRA
jgi:hypothetical protein